MRPSDRGTSLWGQASANTRQPWLASGLLLLLLLTVGSCHITKGMPSSTNLWGTDASKLLG
jgi:hypothetical protein